MATKAGQESARGVGAAPESTERTDGRGGTDSAIVLSPALGGALYPFCTLLPLCCCNSNSTPDVSVCPVVQVSEFLETSAGLTWAGEASNHGSGEEQCLAATMADVEKRRKKQKPEARLSKSGYIAKRPRLPGYIALRAASTGCKQRRDGRVHCRSSICNSPSLACMLLHADVFCL